MISLKRDQGNYKEYTVIYSDCVIHKRKYPTNEPIDCFHRLYLSPEVLRILYKIGKLNKQFRKDRDNIDEILNKIENLEEQLQKIFNNPYELDRDIYSEDYISYIFYDYEYDYILEHTRDGWYVWCRRSNVWSDGELCDVDN